MSPKRSLTGIKPSGIFHIGNYLGAVKPALSLIDEGYEAFYFIANYHSLTLMHNKKELQEITEQIVASWIAFGAADKGATIYLQSDVPEIFELTWILSCFTGKGLLDRAHAYKDALAKNKNISHGVYSYPVLMAADIICFDTDVVPVGLDQKQHVEIAQDIAGSFNSVYKDKILKIPQPIIRENVQTVPGTDGQKMSKSYNNIVPVFAKEEEIRKIISRVPTDSSRVEDPKDPDKSTLFKYYSLFAKSEDVSNLAARFKAGGISWKEVKDLTSDVIINYFRPARERYFEIIDDKSYIKKILDENAKIARDNASSVLSRVRNAIGILRY